MKLRYYLRGLGIGMLVTAFLAGVFGRQETLSDAEIRSRAFALGMVEEGSWRLDELPDAPQNSENPPAIVTEPEKTGEDASESLPEIPGSDQNASAETESGNPAVETPGEGDVAGAEVLNDDTTPVGSSAADSGNVPAGTEPPAVGVISSGGIHQEDIRNDPEEPSGAIPEVERVFFTIRKGASSTSVSRQLMELGLITDAQSFDDYLCQKGYDHHIATGEYSVAKGTTQERLAEIITGR